MAFEDVSKDNDCIMVVEDSDYLNDFIATNLRKQNYDVIQCYNKTEALSKLSSSFLSLVILDLNLGNGESGMSVLQTIRKQDKMLPIMIVSSIKDSDTKIEGFRKGCDDYITKPFYIDELLMRINRMIQKFSMMNYDKKAVSSVYTCGIFEANVDEGTFTKNGVPIHLRKKQFELMVYFLQNPNKILSFKTIYQHVWNEPVPDDKTLESNMYVNIRALRLLIEDDIKKPRHIMSASKAGYIFIPE